MDRHSDAPWHTLTVEETIERQTTDPEYGLLEATAHARRARYGPNELVEHGGRSLWRILWHQVASVMILVLLVAAGFAAALGKPVDAGAILAIIALFVVLGAVQEYRAQNAIAALRRMAAPSVRVIRGGVVRRLSARDLVPGDLLELETGGAVPADARIVDSVGLRLQEAALTGESEPVEKIADALPADDLPLGDRVNMAYGGTSVTFGRGRAIVVATGMGTELGRIATLIQGVRPAPTPLQRRLDALGRTLAAVAVVIALAVVGTGLWRGEDLTLMLLVGVSLAVAIVPEGLPAVLTATLALGGRRMLRRRALIRSLPAVETLGSVTVICSDKTGTLTLNRMTVTVLETLDGRIELDCALPEPAGTLATGGMAALLVGTSLCNDAVARVRQNGTMETVGDPTEAALIVAAAGAGLVKERLEQALPRVGELPFDSGRKRMTTVHAVPDDSDALPADLVRLRAALGAPARLAFTKGAADGLVPLCTRAWRDGRLVPLTAELIERITAATERLTGDGIRVLALALHGLDHQATGPTIERDLVFVGLVGMIDPARAEAADAVAVCRRAGIRPVMITGDHPLTARTIAVRLGIAGPEGRVLTGAELGRMSRDELDAVVDDVAVFARVSPEDKLRIVEALQRRGHVVAMTGDGVNDAPALRRADIGVAMGTGTDVAREAADMVLLNDNFATIVAAVEEGRVVYDNLRRFVLFSVAGNLGKVLIVAVPPLFGLPLLLLPLQILFSNLLTDGLLGLGLGVEKAERDVMTRPPHAPDEGVFSRGGGWHVAWLGGLIAALVSGVGWWYWQDLSADGKVTAAESLVLTTVVFLTLALVQIGRVLSTRSFRDSVFALDPRGNPALLALVAAALVLQFTAVFLPAAQPFFHTVTLSWPDVLVGLGAAAIVLSALEIEKAVRRLSRGGQPVADGTGVRLVAGKHPEINSG